MSNATTPDHAARIMSTAIDWRHILTGVLVGFPALIGAAVGFERVTDYALGEIKQQLTQQRTEAREAEARNEARMGEVRQDVRDLRTRIDQIQQQRGGGR